MIININDATISLLYCCNTGKKDGAFIEVESIVVTLLPSPSCASLVDIIEPVKVDEIIIPSMVLW